MNNKKHYVPLQHNLKLGDEINNGGCYFLSIIYPAIRLTPFDVSHSDIVWIYNRCVMDNLMRADCHILNHDVVMNTAFALLGMQWISVEYSVYRKINIYDAIMFNETPNYVIYHRKIGIEHFYSAIYNSVYTVELSRELEGLRYFRINGLTDRQKSILRGEEDHLWL